MLRKIGLFFENNVEKIVLILAGIICTWLFITHVLLNPNAVEYQYKGKIEKVKPGKIDELISEDAEALRIKLNTPPVEVESYTPRADEFISKIDSVIGTSIDSLTLPNPGNIQNQTSQSDIYKLPAIGTVTDIAFEHIRAAAYVPTETVTAERDYETVKGTVEDIDVVSIEAKFDVAELYDRFEESFVTNVSAEMQDPCLAKPVFASVNLQRRQQNQNGSWSNWQNIPRSKVDHNRQISMSIDDAEQMMPSTVEVRTILFNNSTMQRELLQPPVYQFASANFLWLPPTLHQEYSDAVNKEERQERLEARESSQSSSSSSSGRTSRRDDIGSSSTPTSTRGRGTTSPRRGASTSSSTSTTTQEDIDYIQEVLDEFATVQLTDSVTLEQFNEPVLIWATDDTVEGGNTYQYRIRVGVFNPVYSGTGDEPILWSDFSDITEPLPIPYMLYFFPQNVQEAANTVTMSVFKYKYGYWRKKDFPRVGLGDYIGGVVEYEYDEEVSTNDEAVYPESIDFSTGKMLVDIEEVEDLNDQMRTRKYYNILYSEGSGSEIQTMPVGTSNWPTNMIRTYNEVNRLSNVDPEPFQSWNASTSAISSY